ncbi:MAG: LacI family DNA-binding transcriptional regulator [Candidatus Omnitrophota bacterium]
MKKKNLKYIAGKLGINASTVSRALSKRTEHMVKESTRNKVFDLVKKEGFKPDIQARNLKKQKLTNLTFILPVGMDSIFYNEYYMEILKGLSKVIIDSEYTLTILPIQIDYTADEIFRRLLDHETAGLILSPYCKKLEIPFELLKNYNFPVVSIDNKIEHKNFYNILLDHKHAGALGAKILSEKGYRDLILISDQGKSLHSEVRKKGFYGFFKKNEKIRAEIKNIELPFTFLSGIQAIEAIKRTVKFPAGVFSLNDEIAVNMLINLPKYGITCPRDINLIGFDGLKIGTMTRPRLSSIAFPFEQIGIETASLLINVLDGKKQANTITIQASLIPGESCG